MPEWTQIVRERIAALGNGDADPVIVEELAAHLSQIYDEARDQGCDDVQATAAALDVLDAPDLLRQTLAARRPTVSHRIHQWSRKEPAAIPKGSPMTAFNFSRDAKHA